MRLNSLMVLSLLALAACGTPEYRAEKAICEAKWSEQIPPRLERQIVEKVRYIEVPWGPVICRPVGDKGEQICRQRTRLEDIPYTTVETVDVNRPRRLAEVRACTALACQSRLGNPECRATVSQ